MEVDDHSAVKQAQPLAKIAARKRRIQEWVRRRSSNLQPEPPNLAYSIVYFATVAILLALCVQAAFH